MKIRWDHQVLVGIAIALYLIVVQFLFAGQGWHTVKLFGSAYGLARIKSLTFLVLGGERFRFPFDALTAIGAIFGLGIALTAVWRHFKSRTNLTESQKP